MAKFGTAINADEIPARDDFSPIQPGIYTAMITESEMKQTGNGEGEMLVLEIDVLDNGAEGRKLFERLNLKNKSEKAVEIAYKTLGEIIRAVGKTTIKDSNELHNKRISIDVVVDPAKPYTDKNGNQQAGSPQNRIKKYAVAGALTQTSTPVAVSSPVAATSEAPAASAAAPPPWKKR